MVASPPASSPPPPSGADGDDDGVGDGATRCSSPTPAPRRRRSPNRSGGSTRKSPGSRDFGAGVNKSTLQFKKSRHSSSGSPINWTPRKKTESYMKRKIKRLQETDGMTVSLRETLGNANPHYTRMAREKIAASQAARKATEARKAAMVEASWCSILQAARIQNKNAEEVMEKAMVCATEAFEKAQAMGVMMYDKPDCPHQQYEVESSSHTGGQSTHKVTASFQTAFQVDIEVAAAVKNAFIQLANAPDSSKKEEFKELLSKISQNPDFTESDESNSRIKKENSSSSSVSSDSNSTKVQESINVVNIMVDRLKALHEDELASLAVIVATSGLNAVLQSDRDRCHQTGTVNTVSSGSHRPHSRRYSTAASFVDIQGTKKETASELPSLDKFLVKHLSKLEREVQKAREASRRLSSVKHVAPGTQSQFTVSNRKESADHGNIDVKHMSKLEEEILEANKNSKCSHSMKKNCKDVKVTAEIDAQFGNEESECGKPKSVAENNSDLVGICDSRGSGEDSNHITDFSDYVQDDKENKFSHSHQLPPAGPKSKQGGKRLTRIEAAKLEALKSFGSKDGNTLDVSLDKIFVKPVHRLEKEKREARERQTNVQKPQRPCQSTAVIGSLDDVLVKHVSRLEREKMEYEKRNALEVGGTDGQNIKQKNSAEASDSLDQVLVKHVSRLEKENMKHEKKGGMIMVKKGDTHCLDGPEGSLSDIFVKRPSKLEQAKLTSAAEEKSTSGFNPVLERQKAREKELLSAWGGVGLGTMKPQVSNGKKGSMILVKKGDTHCTDDQEGSLSDIFVKRPSKLEEAKLASAAEEKSTSGFNPVEERRKAREKELLLSAWGGVGLGTMKPQVSKIERDKAAWRKAEEEQKQICATGEL
ncbi:hypothetical protein PR202_ga12637 [Eleusine coracana subsp. coracana]|uniref:Uncharacterized protein n=1 Tax=Eleusine coracana subsp. coracana TaxID=191504 RepID=A0AAV5CC21_ELECO|nr:hypothetical protein QOZ80_3AG0226340 [Eleusine coracana subsp. coracana]GJM95857.1 hypothetical protein PR202_ga12637 [Eleusine coracana subsp. coracana]